MISRLFALIVLVALIAGGLYYWRSSNPESRQESLKVVGREIKDTALTGAVKTAFELNRNLKSLPISVSTEQGTVTLRGDVPQPDSRELAEQVAAAVPEVRQVVNHLRVTGGSTGGASESPPSTAARTLTESVDDKAVEAQVRLALSLNKQIKGTDIKVEVFKNAVTLSGQVPKASQKALAVQIAQDTPGVSSVTDRITAAE
jgi:osmotically-inducible protein OsmY